MRSPWGEALNSLRPRPFNRAQNVLPHFDNIFGEWVEFVQKRTDWLQLDEYEPYDCWLLPLDDTPNVREELDPTRFLLVPYPVFYRGDSFLYLRNLDYKIQSINVTSDETLISVNEDPVYIDDKIYLSDDNFQSWVETYPVATNKIYTPDTGSFKICYKTKTITLGSQYKPEFYGFYNMWDDMGRRLNLPRLDEEQNAAYRDRLLSVLATDPIRSLKYVTLDISRRLGLMKSVDWYYQPEIRNLLLDVQNGVDVTGNYTFTPTLVPGLRESAIDGSVATTLTSSQSATNLGLSFWLYPTGNGTVLSVGGITLTIEDDRLRLGTRSAKIKLKEWQCVTVEISGTDLRFAVDGNIAYEGDFQAFSLTNITIGPFQGKIDEIRLSDLGFDDLDAVVNELIPTGYPVFVTGTRPFEEKELVEETPLKVGDRWMTKYPIHGPYEINNKEQLLDIPVTGNTFVSDAKEPTIRYYKQNYTNGNALIPDQLDYGYYRVYIADKVIVQHLEEYIYKNLVNSQGILTDEGAEFLKMLGEPLLWSTRYWGTSLFLYDETPPMAPTQEIWDQDIVYSW